MTAQASGVLMLSAALAACGGGEPAAEARRLPPVSVATAVAARAPLSEPIDVGGTVRAREHAVLTSRIMGAVLELRAQPGDRVSKGQVLAVLDGREMDANRARAEAMLGAAAEHQAAAEAERAAAGAALRLAQATYDRIARLHERKSATAQELDEATAALDAARSRAAAAAANLQAARSSLAGARAAASAAGIAADYSRIAAPFAGTVTEKHVEPGTMAAPGTPIVTIEGSGAYQVDVRLDESRAARVRWSEPPQVLLDLPDGTVKQVPGRIVERAHALDAAHTVVAKVAVPEGELRTGMFARVIFSGPVRERLAVPAGAIVSRGQLDAVYVVEGDTARYRVVDPGERAGGLVEVRAGLAEGDRVVVEPPANLTDGSPVEPKEPMEPVEPREPTP